MSLLRLALHQTSLLRACFLDTIGLRRCYVSGVLALNNTSNQLIHSQIDCRIDQLFKQFPIEEISYSFGYGSGVFQQAGYDNSNPQIDVIHVVDDPVSFHEVNSARYPGHYSSLLALGVSSVVAVQEYGAGVYFNPYVAMKDNLGNQSMVKYGVVSTETAMTDICEWSNLYIAGRLQKPVRHLYGDDRLRQANNRNLESAFKLALLLSLLGNHRRTVSAAYLYENIALISYMGDPRMLVGGENPNKVKNIVSKQFDKFSTLYRPFLEEALERNHVAQVGNKYEILMDLNCIANTLETLPLQFRRRLFNSYTRKYSFELSRDEYALLILKGGLKATTPTTPGPFLRKILTDGGLNRVLRATIQATIAYPALVQSLKGIFTAGIIKSTKYAWEKKRKSWRA